MAKSIEHACEICGGPGALVCSSSLGPISHAYCPDCVTADREVWGTLVAGLWGCRKYSVADWVKPTIKATCEFYGKTGDQLWEEVEKFEQEYMENRRKEMENGQID